MKVRSLKTNYFLNVFRTGFGTLVGLFTMPYINKVLGAEGLGKVEYVNSIISYFLLFSALGIPMYGIREIAKHRESRPERSKIVIELLIILLITTIISYLILFGVVLQLEYFQNLKSLIVVMSSMILFANIGVEWFYQGIEDQLYITIRYMIVRLLTLLLLFLLVKSPDDYLYYGLIVILSTVGSNFFNIIFLSKHIDFNNFKWSQLEIKKHLRPTLTIFVATLSVSIYLQLDNIMLGSIAGEKYVGYYAMANKLIRFVIVFITTLGAVLLPRLSNLVHTNHEQYLDYSRKAINYILIIAIPFSAIFYLFAEDFTILMGGEEFYPAVATMRLLSPVIIIVGIAYFVGYLILYPQGKERIYTTATIFSAILSIVCNFFIIPKYFQNGTAVVAVLSELLGIFMMIYLGKKQLKEIKLVNRSTILYFTVTFLVTIVTLIARPYLIINSLLLKTLIETVLFLLIFYGILYFVRERLVREHFDILKYKILKK